MRGWSLKTKLIVSIGLFLMLIMITASDYLVFSEKQLLIHQYRELAQTIATSYEVPLTDALMYDQMGLLSSEGKIENYMRKILQQKEFPVVYTCILNPDFKIIFHNRPAEFGKLYYNAVVQQARNQKIAIETFRNSHSQWITQVVNPLTIANKTWGYLVIGFDADIIRSKIKGLYVYLMSLTLLILLISMAIIYTISSRVIRPLAKMVDVIDQFDLTRQEPLPVPETDDEIGFLARRFKEMQKRLIHSRQELEKVQKEIYHAEKLASIGRLTAGVAHEINNPLMGLKNGVRMIQDEPENREQVTTYLNLIAEGLDKIEDIVKKLLEFSRKQPRSMNIVAVNDILKRVLLLLEYRISKSSIILYEDYFHNLAPVKGDPQLIEEVFMNLILNALDSMPGGGRLLIQTRNDGDFVRIAISDTGEGIPEENLEKIFDPFFTTKEVGKGTGLGLSVSLGIVENYGGKITVESRPGEGTTFRVFMPAEKEVE